MQDSQTKIDSANKRYLDSEKGKAALEKYLRSEKGKASRKKYIQSEKGKTAQLKYALSEKGKQNRERTYFFNHLVTQYKDWLKENPEGTMEDFLKGINGNGETNVK